MAKDDNQENKPTQIGGDVDRRSLLAGTAAAAVTSAAATPADARKATPPDARKVTLADARKNVGGPSIRAAIYEDTVYLGTFSNDPVKGGRYSAGAPIENAHQKVKQNFKREEVWWGNYQKLVEPDKSKWGPSAAYDNWETFSKEARESLEKQPAPPLSNKPALSMDPFDTTKRESNLMRHLDECIRIALWDRAIPIQVEVKTKPRRHHNFWTKWNVHNSSSGLVVDSLTLHMDCPDGGWQGVASWRNNDPNETITKFTSTYQVPPEPQAKGDQIIFIFNGLESVSTSNQPGGILQPVLQWTKAGKWRVRSWYVLSTFDQSANSTLPALGDEKLTMDAEGRCYTKASDELTAGQTIVATIEGEKDADGKFNYTCYVDWNSQRIAKLSRTDIPELTFAVCAVESYGVTSPATQYPDPITMTPVQLEVQGLPLNPILWKTSKVGLHFKTTDSDAGSTIEFKL